MRKRCAVFFLGSLLALFIAAGATHADTIGPLTSSISSAATDWNNTLAFNQFNSSLGTLDSVTLYLSATSSVMQVTFTALPTLYGSVTNPNVTVGYYVSTTAGSLPGTYPQITLGNTTTGAFSTPTAGGTLTFNWGTTTGTYSNTYTDSNTLQYFTGTGTATLNAFTITGWNGSNVSNMWKESTNGTTGALTGEVTYNYTPNPVPAPATALLLVPGLIGLALIRKRFKR